MLTLAVASVASWLVVLSRMRGMDAGPGTDLGDVGWFVGVWVTMMAAMMLPSAAPMVLLFSRIAGGSSRHPAAATVVFTCGYLVAWTLYGLLAYGLDTLVVAFTPGFLEWQEHGPLVAGGAIVLAGLYQLSPLKEVCLRHCRAPLSFVMHRWRSGATGPLLMGAEHGAWCVGCCWALMVVLFTVGVMSVWWMAAVALVVLVEKVPPFGERTARAFAVVLVALGVWVAAAPDSVPGLTRPAGGMQMEEM